MSQSLSKVYLHIAFSTKYRQPFIDGAVKERLWSYMGGICRKMDCDPIQVGGYTDHVHILCQLSKNVSQADLLEEVKKRSSKWIKTVGEAYADFYWQKGYAAFSVAPLSISRVVQYIKTQEERHSRQTFQDEMRGFFKKYEVEYDERYVWD
ncbi:MAG: IS200/IS605 family transposase [Prevotellaceae bacterium]|nr:IS200/IS605 family transposase [Prevotellaceae bacterium]